MDNQKKTNKKYFTLYRIVFIGVMAAIVFAVSMLRFPVLGSKVHFGNTMCLLSGLLFGPVCGGLASGIGSFLVDVNSGYPFWEALITLLSKFVMGFLAGVFGNVIRKRMKSRKGQAALIIAGSAVGALSYVALYMLKHFVLQIFVYQSGWTAMIAVLASKFPASIINAGFAIVCAPILFFAIYPGIRHIPAYEKSEIVTEGKRQENV